MNAATTTSDAITAAVKTYAEFGLTVTREEAASMLTLAHYRGQCLHTTDCTETTPCPGRRISNHLAEAAWTMTRHDLGLPA